MSENPYQSAPSLPNTVQGAAKQKPTGLTVVPVICLILGVLGVITGLLGVVMTVFQGFATDLQGMQPNPEVAEFQQRMQQFQQSQFIPNLIVNACNLIVGSLLIFGSIGVLGLKEWGRTLLRKALLIASIFVVLRGIFMIWVQYSTMDFMKDMMPAQGAGNAETFAMMMQVGLIIGVVIGLTWVAVLAGFYLWSRSYLNKPSIVPLFNVSGK